MGLHLCQLCEIAYFVTDKIPLENVYCSLIMLQQTLYFRIKKDDVSRKIFLRRSVLLLTISVAMF